MTMSQRAKGKKKGDILVNAELIYKVMGNHHLASSSYHIHQAASSLPVFVYPCLAHSMLITGTGTASASAPACDTV